MPPPTSSPPPSPSSPLSHPHQAQLQPGPKQKPSTTSASSSSSSSSSPSSESRKLINNHGLSDLIQLDSPDRQKPSSLPFSLKNDNQEHQSIASPSPNNRNRDGLRPRRVSSYRTQIPPTQVPQSRPLRHALDSIKPKPRRLNRPNRSSHDAHTPTGSPLGLEVDPIDLNRTPHHDLHQKPRRVDPIFARFRSSFSALLLYLFKLTIWPFRFLLTTILPHTFGGLVAFLTLIAIAYLLVISFTNLMGRMNITNSIGLVSKSIYTFITSPIVYFYCSTIRGPFCGSHRFRGATNPKRIAQIARTVSGTAQKAADIFDSVVQLSDPNELGLHQTEILELSYAVRWSTELANKEFLSDGLAELSDLTRDLKDKLIDLNGQGLNAFSFIAYEFSRLGDLIEWVQTGKKRYTSETISHNLEILFEHLSKELKKLLNLIESIIPLATRSKDLGIQISSRLHQEHYSLINQKATQTLWRKLLDLTQFSGQQLQRDLDLTSQSIVNLRNTWLKLEEIRTDLLSYRNNVANFKASFIGWHLADHQLTPEDELYSMRGVIEKFKLTIKEVKSNSRLSTSSTPLLDSTRKIPINQPESKLS